MYGIINELTMINELDSSGTISSSGHKRPLIILPKLNLMYFGDDVKIGFHMNGTSISAKNTGELLSEAMKDGGDFQIYQVGGGKMVLAILYKCGRTKLCLTAWDFMWHDFLNKLVKIQAWLRHIIWKSGKFRPNLALIKEFRQSDAAILLPDEIILKITEAYFLKKMRLN